MKYESEEGIANTGPGMGVLKYSLSMAAALSGSDSSHTKHSRSVQSINWGCKSCNSVPGGAPQDSTIAATTTGRSVSDGNALCVCVCVSGSGHTPHSLLLSSFAKMAATLIDFFLSSVY